MSREQPVVQLVTSPWPLLGPIVVVNVTPTLMDACNVFDLIYVMTQAGRANATRTDSNARQSKSSGSCGALPGDRDARCIDRDVHAGGEVHQRRIDSRQETGRGYEIIFEVQELRGV